MPLARQPFSGTFRKLVISFDVGTTYSGVSYAVLEPGLIPEIRGVTRFPSQEWVNGSTKIPSVLFYNKIGQVCAAGAATLDPNIIDTAEAEEWFKCEWFKLHLKPKSDSFSATDILGSLPPNKTEVDVFGDYLHYLMLCTREFLGESLLGGKEFWGAVENQIEYVLSHPNGWGGLQQQKMKQAAIRAGLVRPDSKDSARIHFVTEGEASLHFCINNVENFSEDPFKKNVMVIDAGGGTVDISGYSRTASGTYREFHPPECLFSGSVFVTLEAQEFLRDKLKDSAFAEELPHIVRTFDQTTKLGFRSPSQPCYIRFGRRSDTDASLDIKAGQLILEGGKIAEFFEPSIQTIFRTVFKLIMQYGNTISTVFLVGGYSANPYLYSKLEGYLPSSNPRILCRPNQIVNKAVADGSVSYYIDHLVLSRMSRNIYGVECIRDFDKSDPEHVRNAHKIQMSCSGKRELHGCFDIILNKATQVSEAEEFKRPYFLERFNLEELNTVTTDILCYRGSDPNPRWLERDSDDFVILCTISADTSEVCKTIIPRTSKKIRYYRLDYEIVLSMGTTELKAQVSWREKGREKRSPAKIVYRDDT